MGNSSRGDCPGRYGGVGCFWFTDPGFRRPRRLKGIGARVIEILDGKFLHPKFDHYFNGSLQLSAILEIKNENWQTG